MDREKETVCAKEEDPKVILDQKSTPDPKVKINKESIKITDHGLLMYLITILMTSLKLWESKALYEWQVLNMMGT